MVVRQLAQDMRMPIRMTITTATKQLRPSRVASVLLRYRRRLARRIAWMWRQLEVARMAEQLRAWRL